MISRTVEEIDADDVKCAHGATVGQLDDEVVHHSGSTGELLGRRHGGVHDGVLALGEDAHGEDARGHHAVQAAARGVGDRHAGHHDREEHQHQDAAVHEILVGFEQVHPLR